MAQDEPLEILLGVDDVEVREGRAIIENAELVQAIESAKQRAADEPQDKIVVSVHSW